MPLNLIDLCLDTTAENFQRYNLVFLTTEDDNMKLKLEFLQRKYSFHLLARLCVKDDLPETYIDLLINKYLTVLDTSWFRKCSWDKVASKIAEIGCNIEKIIMFEEFYGKMQWQDIICHLCNLKSFTFHYSCDDLILKNVAKFCPNIEEIYIKNTAVTPKAAKYLCKNEDGKPLCTNLKKLCISDTSRKDDVKYLLKNLPSLEIIDYVNLPIVLYLMHKNDLSRLDKVAPYKIITLNLKKLAHSSFLVDILKVCLSVCPHLKSFTCGLADSDKLNYFSNLSDLEMLHIKSFTNSEININNLLKSKGGKLTSLTVENCTVSVSVLAESCPHIKELTLNRVNFLFDEDIKSVFNSLSTCTFKNSNVSASISSISLLLLSSPKLESISFIRCNLLSFEIKADILKCCELYPIKKISFYRSEIEIEYIKDLLLNCRTLSILNVKRCFDINDEIELAIFAEILSNKPKIIISSCYMSSKKHTLIASFHLDNDSDSEYDSDYDYNYGFYDEFQFYYHPGFNDNDSDESSDMSY